jgi:hypothetical protein
LADLIDFEGYGNGDSLGPVSTATNVATFWARIDTTHGTGMFEAEVRASQSGDPPVLGSRYLIDQNPQSHKESYFIQFDKPVTDISLHFFDFDSSDPTDTA